MDLLGIAALGGLERITIVAGAVIIGYWGYRLYAAEKKAGLVFMGLAVVVLAGALATGTSHVKNVAEGFQLASIPASAPHAPATPEDAIGVAADAAAADDQSPFAADPPVEAVGEVADAPASKPAPAPAGGTTQPRAEPAPAALTDTAADPAEADSDVPTAVVSPVRLATGEELGGRIVSVKSENVSLEWSASSEPEVD